MSYYESPLDLQEAARLRVVSIVCHHAGRGYRSDSPHVVMHLDDRGSVLYEGPGVKEELGRNAYWLTEDGIRRNGRQPRLPETAREDTSVRHVLVCPCGVNVPAVGITELSRRAANAEQWEIELRAVGKLTSRIKSDTP